jgi:hypothetical protein
MGSKRKRAEFELPSVLIEAISGYLGPAAVNRLTTEQAHALMTEATACAARVGEILNLKESHDEEEPEPNGD